MKHIQHHEKTAFQTIIIIIISAKDAASQKWDEVYSLSVRKWQLNYRVLSMQCDNKRFYTEH
jgi:hypothetical protein